MTDLLIPNKVPFGSRTVISLANFVPFYCANLWLEIINYSAVGMTY